MRTDLANFNRKPSDLNTIRESIASVVLIVLENQFRVAIDGLEKTDNAFLYNVGRLSAAYGTLRADVLTVLNYGREL